MQTCTTPAETRRIELARSPVDHQTLTTPSTPLGQPASDPVCAVLQKHAQQAGALTSSRSSRFGRAASTAPSCSRLTSPPLSVRTCKPMVFSKNGLEA